MSFSSDTKNELAQTMPEKRCCMLAEISGILRTCGAIRLTGPGRIGYRLVTENAAVARRIIRLFKEYFSIKVELSVSKNVVLKKNNFYEILIGEETRCEEILRETGILKVKDGFNFFDYGIDEVIIKKKCCRRAFLRGTFLGSGSVTNPGKSYHMEIVTTNNVLCADLIKLMGMFDIQSKSMERKGSNVIYIKDSGQISDLLNVIGAHKSMLELENTKVIKETYNQVNRIMNCDGANINKTIEAAEKQIKAINKIIELKGMDFLQPKLREIALLRLEKNEASLQELGEMLNPPLGKSGVNHRMAKIMEIASRIKA